VSAEKFVIINKMKFYPFINKIIDSILCTLNTKQNSCLSCRRNGMFGINGNSGLGFYVAEYFVCLVLLWSARTPEMKSSDVTS
jgi:hypothetical protein